MSHDASVYVAEAYKDGERIEQIVHTSYADAKEDIEVCTSLKDVDEIEVHERHLYLGNDDEFHVAL